MVIYGIRAVHLKSAQPITTSCSSCNSKGSLLMSVYRRHAHVFWVPLFPVGKTGVYECQHCKQVVESSEMQDSNKREYIKLKNEAKGPIWQFAGLGIIAIFIAWINIQGIEDKKLELEYIVAPQIGDVYEYKIGNGSYSTLMVTDVTSDSVFVSPNEYEISRITKIYKIKESDNYSDQSYAISKVELKEMYDSDVILDIDR